MTAFVELGVAAIAALTLLLATTITMQAKERINSRRQDTWLAAQREAIAAATRANRDTTRAIIASQQDTEDQ
jgi:hypothetical protein